MRINFAVIGLGTISRYFIEALKNNHQANLAAVCDLNPDKKKEHEDILFYESIDELLENDAIQAVVVCLPNHLHFEVVSKCLKSGKITLCEKPLGINYQETRKLVELAQKRQLLLMTAFHRRYNSNFKKIIQSNVSPIKLIHARYLENISQHTSEGWEKDVFINGGGCIIDNGINVIDAIRHLVGNIKIKKAHIGKRTIENISYDANAYLQFKFGKGCNFNLELDWHYAGEKKDMTVYFDNGNVEYIDFLENYKVFKSSLFHEYQSIIDEFIEKYLLKYYSPDTNSLEASRLVEQIYKKMPTQGRH